MKFVLQKSSGMLIMSFFNSTDDYELIVNLKLLKSCNLLNADCSLMNVDCSLLNVDGSLLNVDAA